MDKIKKYNSDWLPLYVKSEEGVAFFNFDEVYYEEIRDFLDRGGFARIENDNENKRIEVQENIKNQRKSNKIGMWGLIIAIIGIIISVIVAKFLS